MAPPLNRQDSDSLNPMVADQVAVGSEKILTSPHVSEGPGRIANAPVPSVFCDDRGEIHRLRVGGKRLNLLFSKANVMRSGYLHPNYTKDYIISGQVEVWTLTPTNTEKKIYQTGEYFCVDPYVPHILHFLQDSIVLEWNEPGQFRCWYYHPYRRIIEVQNSLVATTTGHFSRLVPLDEKPLLLDGSNNTSSSSWSTSSIWNKLTWWTGGVICGMALGTLLVHRRK